MQERKKKQMFKLQPNVAWRQFDGKKDIMGKFADGTICTQGLYAVMMWCAEGGKRE